MIQKIQTSEFKEEATLIEEQWKLFYSLIDKIEDDRRKVALHNLCDDYAVRLMTCPASSKTDRIGAFSGGLVWHSLGVLRIMKELVKLYEAKVTTDELITVGLFFDIGKIGTPDDEYYCPQASKWHFDNGFTFDINKKLLQNSVQTRSVWWLCSKYGIQLSEREINAILSLQNIKDMYASDVYNSEILTMLLQQSVQANCVKNKGISTIYGTKKK